MDGPIRPGKDRAMLSTELAILMPVLVVIALVAVFVVNVERHHSRTQQAADAAARAASLSGTASEGLAAAHQAAARVCRGPVAIDEAAFSYQAPDLSSYTPGMVTVRLGCSETVAGFEPLIPSSQRVAWAKAVSTVEYWRPRP